MVRESIEPTSARWSAGGGVLEGGRKGMGRRGKWYRAWRLSSRGRLGSQQWMEGEGEGEEDGSRLCRDEEHSESYGRGEGRTNKVEGPLRERG